MDLVALCDATSEEAARLFDLAGLPGASTKGAAGYLRAARVALRDCLSLVRDEAEGGGRLDDDRSGLEDLAESLGGAVIGALVEGSASEEELEAAVLRAVLAVALARAELAERLGRTGVLEKELAVAGIRARLSDLGAIADLTEALGPRRSLGGSLALVANDEPLAFLVEVQRGRLRTRERRGPADVVVVGPVSGLCRFLYGRGIGRELEVTGDRAIAQRLGALPLREG